MTGIELIEVLQLVYAILLGTIIGIQRELKHKPAGITTITIVTLTSTLIVQVTQHMLEPMGITGDPSRITAAVITGIGFLGAGVILRTGTRIQGITTAATIWLMAAVGLAIGVELYWHAAIVVGLVTLEFWLDPYLDRLITHLWKHRE
jgi:putative Mg2+ transporter-C (MgtC) family protein